MEFIEKGKVQIHALKKAERKIFKDEFGYIMKHLGAWQTVEKNDNGFWVMKETNLEIYYKRNPHKK